MQAGKIRDIQAIPLYPFCAVSGFGWGQSILPMAIPWKLSLVISHRYCWTEGKSYPDAPESGNVRALRKQLKGYDVALFGDNHQAFIDIGGNGCTIINCGGFIRRKSDEIDREPCVGLLFEDGSVKLHKLDTGIDKFHTDAKQREETAVDVQQFISELEELGEHGLNFREVVKRHLDGASDLSEGARQIIREALL